MVVIVSMTYRTPTPLEERGKEVNANERHVASGNDGLIFLWRRNAYEETNVEHGQTHRDGGPEERLATSEGVGGEDEEESAHDHLDDAIDSSGD